MLFVCGVMFATVLPYACIFSLLLFFLYHSNKEKRHLADCCEHKIINLIKSIKLTENRHGLFLGICLIHHNSIVPLCKD